MAIATKKWELLTRSGIASEVVESGVVDSPNAQGAAIYIKAVDDVRGVEINNAWGSLLDYFRENGLYFNSAGTIYAYIELDASGGASSGIVQESIVGNIPDGAIAIGIGGALRDSNAGSQIFAALIGNCQLAANDNYLKQV